MKGRFPDGCEGYEGRWIDLAPRPVFWPAVRSDSARVGDRVVSANGDAGLRQRFSPFSRTGRATAVVVLGLAAGRAYAVAEPVVCHLGGMSVDSGVVDNIVDRGLVTADISAGDLHR